MTQRNPTSTLFPYTTLFRSDRGEHKDDGRPGGQLGEQRGTRRWTESRLAAAGGEHGKVAALAMLDRKSTRLNSSHRCISYAVFCLKKKKISRGRPHSCL